MLEMMCKHWLRCTYHSSRSDTEANNETTNSHLSDAVGSGLENGTDSEKNTANVDSDFATILRRLSQVASFLIDVAYLVSSQASDDSTYESTSTAKGSDEFFLAGRGWTSIKVVVEIDQNGRDDTSIVAEERPCNRGCHCNKPHEPTSTCIVDVVVGISDVGVGHF